jgi:hypothetical protein
VGVGGGERREVFARRVRRRRRRQRRRRRGWWPCEKRRARAITTKFKNAPDSAIMRRPTADGSASELPMYPKASIGIATSANGATATIVALRAFKAIPT